MSFLAVNVLTQTNTANVWQVLFLILCQFSSTVLFTAQNAPLPMQSQSREMWLKHITQLYDVITSLRHRLCSKHNGYVCLYLERKSNKASCPLNYFYPGFMIPADHDTVNVTKWMYYYILMNDSTNMHIPASCISLQLSQILQQIYLAQVIIKDNKMYKRPSQSKFLESYHVGNIV